MNPVSGSFDVEYSLAASWKLPLKLPTTVKGCHKLLVEQQEVIEALQKANGGLRKKAAADDLKKKLLREKLSAAGRRGGRGNIGEN
jgi:hypothetical protein